jgi:hypothetical protein
MSEQETSKSILHPEQLVAENVSEAVWLRFSRLTSPTLCERTIAARAPTLSAEVIAKGTGTCLCDSQCAWLLEKRTRFTQR